MYQPSVAPNEKLNHFVDAYAFGMTLIELSNAYLLNRIDAANHSNRDAISLKNKITTHRSLELLKQHPDLIIALEYPEILQQLYQNHILNYEECVSLVYLAQVAQQFIIDPKNPLGHKLLMDWLAERIDTQNEMSMDSAPSSSSDDDL